ncbi:unnamed protein product [Cuscuta epithymum]|uniref:Reverse transcriptase Ty1/copia-type domain-containing protein n=1 Tax=Cuscuta epithymum TaxID=186058 RepID=A0AAV0FGU9_9ASTE|nr:unnamed protein product [Cuscuta epithymum]
MHETKYPQPGKQFQPSPPLSLPSLNSNISTPPIPSPQFSVVPSLSPLSQPTAFSSPPISPLHPIIQNSTSYTSATNNNPPTPPHNSNSHLFSNHQPNSTPPMQNTSTSVTIHTPNNSTHATDNTSLQMTATSPPSSSNSQITPPRPTRIRAQNPKYFGSPFVNLTTRHPVSTTLEPASVKEALRDPRWQSAMEEEMAALRRNQTWTLVPRTSQTPITCKWLFRIKRHADGSVARFKARLVARGFLQQPGRDYAETFSPVTKPATIRIILSLALSRQWPLRQLDVNNAFLHGSLSEEVYMVQPAGFVDSAHPKHVCRLHKALYGLKQAPRAWYLELSRFLISTGFRKSRADASLFIYAHHDVLLYFLVYVDDIILTGNNLQAINKFVSQLTHRFSVKDLGALHHFLGVETITHPDGIFLSQRQYILHILDEYKLDGAKEVATPMSSSSPPLLTDGQHAADASNYRKALGLLQYLAFTRPDISFAVNRLSQFMHAPTNMHFQGVKRILRYLKGTINYGLFIKRCASLPLTAFSDSDWGGINDGGKSTTGYALYLGSNIISWKSAKQKTVARSSTEAEFRAVANASAEVLWIRNLLSEIGIRLPTTPRIFCDNQGATHVCVNPVFHSRMKHVALDFFFVRDLVENGQLMVQHVSNKFQIADILTKPLGKSLFEHFRSKMGVSDGTSILRGRIKA